MARVVLPKADVGAIRAFAAARIPPEHLDKLRLEVEMRGRSVNIIELTPPWIPGAEPDWIRRRVAQLRYDDEARLWSLYCLDSNERLWLYDGVNPTPRVIPLLDEIGDDPTGIFWG